MALPVAVDELLSVASGNTIETAHINDLRRYIESLSLGRSPKTPSGKFLMGAGGQSMIVGGTKLMSATVAMVMPFILEWEQSIAGVQLNLEGGINSETLRVFMYKSDTGDPASGDLVAGADTGAVGAEVADQDSYQIPWSGGAITMGPGIYLLAIGASAGVTIGSTGGSAGCPFYWEPHGGPPTTDLNAVTAGTIPWVYGAALPATVPTITYLDVNSTSPRIGLEVA